VEIPVIDIFAGPGGLGEGFSALIDSDLKRKFKIVLSIEKDTFAHQTLTLRSFYRQFDPKTVPDDYYEFLRGKISLDTLYDRWPQQSELAKKEALLATLGEGGNAISDNDLDSKIIESLKGEKNWLLIGGPPCQAYSVVGRSRRKQMILDESTDEKVGLYRQYLKILAVHNPPVFVMENVKGLLSAKTKENAIFSKILSDLSDPVRAFQEDVRYNNIQLDCPGYKIYSLILKPRSFDKEGKPVYRQKDFLIHSEKFGIPQTRHRLILFGIRNDIDIIPDFLQPTDEIPISSVLSGLPKLRSGLSKVLDDTEKWNSIIQLITKKGILNGINLDVRNEILRQIEFMKIQHLGTGAEYILCNNINSNYCPDWYLDFNIHGVCNHSSRGHMERDLLRYFFISCYAKVKNVSPKLEDFPSALLPDHKNVKEGIENKKFADRFRVQLWNHPSKTITSHISKDGHYYIHPDPVQCRSFSVREAARIQTFPDNYYFCGPRTSQYIQVGNAVPPLLAHKIAKIVFKVIQINKNKNLKLAQVNTVALI
jgi:DNA (cytosine-5)-methyltransferase 1